MSADEQTLARTRASVEHQGVAFHLAQYGFDRGRREVDFSQLETEQRHIDVQQQNLGPQITIDVRRDLEVKEVKWPAWNARNETRIGHHGQHFRSANLAITFVVNRDKLPFGIAGDRAHLDVVEVSIHNQLQAGPQTTLDACDADTGFESHLDADAQLGLFKAACARHEGTVAESGHGPVVDIETIQHIQNAAARERFLHAIGVVTERQIGIQPHATKGIHRNHQRNRDDACRQDGQIGLKDKYIEIGQFKFEVRHLIGEQGSAATRHQLGPVRDVRDVRQELQA